VYSVATASAPHSGAIPSVGPARQSFGGFAGPGGLLDSPSPGAALSATLSADAHDFTWAAAVVGSNNAAGYQLGSGAPIMAVGGFNGTDPSPTLEEFQRLVADRQIHYFIRGKMMLGHWGGETTGSRESADIAEWVETHYTPQTVDRVVIYDLTQPPSNS
jgi:4-amino-4-deoxy-L-arabinose transferase-like glycosyltransferase